MMGRDEGMMEVEPYRQPWREKELKRAKKIAALDSKKEKGGTMTETSKNKDENRKRDSEQTLPWQAPVRWLGMNPLRQG